MLIQQKHEDNKGSFYIEESGKILAEMTWSMTGSDLMTIDHTEVADELRGKNVGYELVKAAVEYARTNHMKIVPRCPFANAVFNKRAAEFGDVLRSN